MNFGWCQCRFINCNKCITQLLRGLLIMMEALHMWGHEKISVPPEFCCKSQIALKIKVYFLISHTKFKGIFFASFIWRTQTWGQTVPLVTVDPFTHLEPGVFIVRIMHTDSSMYILWSHLPPSHLYNKPNTNIILFAISQSMHRFCLFVFWFVCLFAPSFK